MKTISTELARARFPFGHEEFESASLQFGQIRLTPLVAVEFGIVRNQGEEEGLESDGEPFSGDRCITEGLFKGVG